MTDILNSLPTPAQLVSLSNNIPPVAPHPPQADRLLAEIISLCTPKWKSDFLFTPDAIHVQHFSAPTFPQKSLLYDVSTTRHRHQESSHNASRFLFTPAFVVDSTTIGVGVMDGSELRGSSTSLIHPIRLCMNFRFLHNAEQRKFLMVNDTPELDCILIYYAHHVTPQKCHSFTARFSRSKLRRIFNSNGRQLIISDLMPSLIHILEERLVRRCPICHTEALGPGAYFCNCAFNHQPPEHPYDFDHFHNAFRSDFGFFQGFANKITADSSHAIYGVKLRMNWLKDDVSASSMARWALKRYLRFSQSPFDSALISHGSAAASADLSVVPAISLDGQADADEDFEINVQPKQAEKENDALSELLAILPADGPMGSPVSENVQSTGVGVSELQLMPSTVVDGGLFGMSHEVAAEGLQWWEQDDASHSTGVTGALESMEDIEQDLRKACADERRKQRNRESAKRSNAKNKAKRLEEKRELQELYDKEQELRTKETALRNENLKLRRLVGQ